MDDYIERLNRENLNLIILKGKKTLFKSKEDGMRPLLEAIDTIGITMLNDTIVIDKIVGKAAALLVSYFQAQEVHCGVLSAKAMELLNRQGIRYCYQKLIPIIMNKSGTDICPFEKVVMDVETPREGYEQLSAKLKSLIR